MTFVPNAGLEALAASLAAGGAEVRVEMFSCRKASAILKKRDRSVLEPENPVDAPGSHSIVEAGSALENFRSSSFSDDSVLQAYMPALVATMNALYDGDGFDFTGVLTEEHFKHITDPIEFETQAVTAMGKTIDIARMWKVIGDAALAKDTSDASKTPSAGPVTPLGEWAALFTLKEECPFVPECQDGSKARHFFAYCRKTRLMVAIIASSCTE
jgi:hypothetical protein